MMEEKQNMLFRREWIR